jgi:hypothetical protein
MDIHQIQRHLWESDHHYKRLSSVQIPPTNSSALIQRGHMSPNPRRHFQTDLRLAIGQFQRNGESIILSCNFNNNLDICSSVTACLCKDYGLVDIFALQHPDYTEFSTYICGTKRIGYYLLSHDILPVVTAAGYEPFHYRSTSDH